MNIPKFLSHLYTCSYDNDSEPAPHVPFQCREDSLNFFNEFLSWDKLLQLAEKSNNSELKLVAEYLENMADNYPSCQKTLYDFPLYYIGT